MTESPTPVKSQVKQHEPIPPCERCQKTPRLCVCDSISPIKTKTKVLILQHPQEPDKTLGTARIAHLMLINSKLLIALSRRNLEHALGDLAPGEKIDPKDWLVLYLGSAKPPRIAPGGDPKILVLNRESKPHPDSDQILRRIKGILVLDGTWSQAKALWWRNAWILKLQRAVLCTPQRSLYGKLRKEPRPESVSTIESLGLALAILEGKSELNDQLLVPFKALLERCRARGNLRR